MAKIGLRNIIGNTVSGRATPKPPATGGFLLWKLGSTNKIMLRTSNNDKLLWKDPTP